MHSKSFNIISISRNVAGKEHRYIVKQAFNAMFQASTTLDRKPDGIELDEIGMSWRELKEEIPKAHKPYV